MYHYNIGMSYQMYTFLSYQNIKFEIFVFIENGIVINLYLSIIIITHIFYLNQISMFWSSKTYPYHLGNTNSYTTLLYIYYRYKPHCCITIVLSFIL